MGGSKNKNCYFFISCCNIAPHLWLSFLKTILVKFYVILTGLEVIYYRIKDKVTPTSIKYKVERDKRYLSCKVRSGII